MQIALPFAGPAAIADQVAMHSELWVAVVLTDAEFSEGTIRICDELQFVLDDEGEGRSVRLIDEPTTAALLVNEILGAESQDIAVVRGIELLSATELETLDLFRNALMGRGVIVLASESGLIKVHAHSPNVWSWIAGKCFRYDKSEGVMDVPERLDSLREHYKLTDQQVLDLSLSNALPSDPAFVEWLVLLGRGDLSGT